MKNIKGEMRQRIRRLDRHQDQYNSISRLLERVEREMKLYNIIVHKGEHLSGSSDRSLKHTRTYMHKTLTMNIQSNRVQYTQYKTLGKKD